MTPFRSPHAFGQCLGKCWRPMTNSPEIGQHMDLACHCSQKHAQLVGMAPQTRANAYYTPAMVKWIVRTRLKPTEPKCMMEELDELEVDLAAGQVDAAEVPEGYTVLKDASRQQIRKWLQDFHNVSGHPPNRVLMKYMERKQRRSRP